MESNIMQVAFGSLRTKTTQPMYRLDVEQYLKFVDIELPANYRVDFGLSESGDTISMVGTEDGVLIPDNLLINPGTLHAWIWVDTGTYGGKTCYHAIIPVKKRGNVTDIEPTPSEQSTIDTLIRAMNEAVDDAEASATAAEQAAQSIDGKVARAEAAAQAADTAATNAEDAKDAANLFASNAAESAEAAHLSEVSAEGSASTATTKAAEAANSAAQAAASAASIEGDVQEAEQAAQQATQAANAAEQSEANARESALAASGSEVNASMKAAEASAYATTASGKATESSNSATAAQNAQTGAEAAQAAAEAVLESIPEDYSELSDDVSELKNAISKVTGETRNLFNLNNLFVGYAWNGSVNTTRACAYIPMLGGEEYIISFPTATASRFDAITAFEKVNISDTTNLYLSGISSGFTRTASSSAKVLGIQFTKTGITKADLDDLVFQVEYGNKTSPFIQNETATDLTVRDEMVTFITPEMFGAWGDGVHDDTAALQAALDTAKNVKANKTYKITSSLTMTPVGQFGQRFYFNKIICSVNQPALVLNGRNGYVDGLYLESPNDCIRLGNTAVSYDWYIHVSWAKSTGGSAMTIGGGGNVSECTIVGERFTYYSEGVHFDLAAGFVGQNRIIGVAFECISNPDNVAGWAFSANGSSYPMTGLALFDVSLEGAHGGFNFSNSQVSLPINPLYCFGLRTSELTDVNGYKLFRLTGNGIIAGDIFGDIINLDSIDVTLHNPNILYEQSFNFHGRLKWKGRGWQNARIVGNKIVPKFAESFAGNVASPIYDDNNLPYTTNLISGTASWDVTFPFDGEIVFIATSANTQLTINGSVITMNNTEVVKVRTELWQNPSQPSDIRTNVLITRPNGTIAVKTLS